MQFLELVKKRYSVRSYKPDKVEREKILRCLEAARLAPSACNSQPWKFIVVDEPELKNKVASETIGKLISFNHFAFQAPVIIVAIIENANITSTVGSVLKGIPYQYMDVGIAIEHFCLQATEERLGTCILGYFNEKPLKNLLKIPQSKKIAALITLGYAAKAEIPEKIRKPIDKIVGFNEY